MRNQILTALVCLPCIGQATEHFEYDGGNPHNVGHHFSPIGFYKKHWEGKYRYEFSGVGIKYDYKKSKGLNLGTSLISNLETMTTYIETEGYLSINYPFQCFTFFPKILHRSSSHKIIREENKDLHITKGTTFVGGGIWTHFDWPFDLKLEGYLFRDLYNVLTVGEGPYFQGARYDNPFGIRGDLAISWNHSDIFNLDLAGNYSYSFEKEYWDRGVQLSFGWRF